MDKMREQKISDFKQIDRAKTAVVASKKNSTICFCVGYRRLNAVAKAEVYLIPCKDECIDSLCESQHS